jgi:hypothetical protein
MENHSLVYPIIQTEKWAKRYSLSVRSNPCENCGEMLFPTKPFATKNWRGLMSEPHSCGKDFDLFIATKANPAERCDYINYFQILRNQLTCVPQ